MSQRRIVHLQVPQNIDSIEIEQRHQKAAWSQVRLQQTAAIKCEEQVNGVNANEGESRQTMALNCC